MCGRFVVAYTYDELRQFLKTTFDPFVIKHKPMTPDYNVAPSKGITSMVFDGETYRIGQLKWGFKPFERFKYPLINIRSETIDEKAIYRHSLHSRRCIIFASGFYEWQDRGLHKQPFYIYPKMDKIWMFAGIYTAIKSRPNQAEFTTAILTKEAQEEVEHIHERMPVILSEDDAKIWLDPSVDDVELKSLFTKRTHSLISHPVDLIVNNVHQNSIDNIKKSINT